MGNGLTFDAGGWSWGDDCRCNVETLVECHPEGTGSGAVGSIMSVLIAVAVMAALTRDKLGKNRTTPFVAYANLGK